jgi:hypothetical protein
VFPVPPLSSIDFLSHLSVSRNVQLSASGPFATNSKSTLTTALPCPCLPPTCLLHNVASRFATHFKGGRLLDQPFHRTDLWQPYRSIGYSRSPFSVA